MAFLGESECGVELARCQRCGFVRMLLDQFGKGAPCGKLLNLYRTSAKEMNKGLPGIRRNKDKGERQILQYLFGKATDFLHMLSRQVTGPSFSQSPKEIPHWDSLHVLPVTIPELLRVELVLLS